MRTDWLAHFNPNHDPKTGRFTRTAEGQKSLAKALRRKKDKDKIMESLDKEDLEKLRLVGEFNTQEQIDKWKKEGTLYPHEEVELGGEVLKRIIKKVGGVPVGFLDVFDASFEFAVDKKYRNLGYASDLVKKGMNWIERNKDKLADKKFGWAVRSDNMPSRHLAEKHGFELSDWDKKVIAGGSTPAWLLYYKK